MVAARGVAMLLLAANLSMCASLATPSHSLPAMLRLRGGVGSEDLASIPTPRGTSTDSAHNLASRGGLSSAATTSAVSSSAMDLQEAYAQVQMCVQNLRDAINRTAEEPAFKTEEEKEIFYKPVEDRKAALVSALDVLSNINTQTIESIDSQFRERAKDMPAEEIASFMEGCNTVEVARPLEEMLAVPIADIKGGVTCCKNLSTGKYAPCQCDKKKLQCSKMFLAMRPKEQVEQHLKLQEVRDVPE